MYLSREKSPLTAEAKTAVITGGSRGIGEQCVRLFAENGYRVYFTYKSSAERAEKLARETGAAAVKCDVSRAEEVESFAAFIKNRGHQTDVLINNAGVSQIKLFTDISEKDWDFVFDVNIKGMFLMTRALIGDMIRRKYGRIINISSMWGVSGGSCEVHYSASKAAVIGFTKALAKEEGPSGICVNCIAPGVIETEMNAALDEEAKRELCEETPLMRLGTPQEVARTALFLASDGAGFITGQVISVDGGITV